MGLALAPIAMISHGLLCNGVRPALILASGFALRLALIFKFPLIFGGDPMLRMIHRDRILISHQLPVLQLLIFAVARVTHNYLITMAMMGLIGASVGLAFYLLLRHFIDRQAAFLAALMITTNPFLTGDSIVPFQESLMLVLVLFALRFFYAEAILGASLCLGLACLTRFEAWAAAPVLAAALVWKRGLSLGNIVRGIALFGWAPIAWIIFQKGLAPEGSYVVESHVTLARFMRLVYLGYIALKFTPLIVIALSVIGLWVFWRQGWLPRLWPLVAFVVLFTIALLFSAHGDLPDPERRIAAREATLWIAAIYVLAAIALSSMPRYRTPVAVLGLIFGIWGSYRYVEHEASDPHLVLSYRLAKFFDTSLARGEQALVRAPPWPSHVFDFYLQRARETGGEAGFQAAVRSLADSDVSPPAFQRMLIHSRFDRSRFLSAPGPCTNWVAVWSDYQPVPNDSNPPLLSLQTTLRDADLSIQISRRDCR